MGRDTFKNLNAADGQNFADRRQDHFVLTLGDALGGVSRHGLQNNPELQDLLDSQAAQHGGDGGAGCPLLGIGDRCGGQKHALHRFTRAGIPLRRAGMNADCERRAGEISASARGYRAALGQVVDDSRGEHREINRQKCNALRDRRSRARKLTDYKAGA